MSEEGLWRVYIDGTYRRTPRGVALGAAVGYSGAAGQNVQALQDYEFLNCKFEQEHHRLGIAPTPSRAELLGLLSALEALRQNQGRWTLAAVYSDFTACVVGYGKYLDQWKKNGWYKGNGGRVANIDLWQEIDALRDSRIRLLKVKAHRGIHLHEQLNQFVDQEAKRLLAYVS